MNEATLPPSPNWYLGNILACAKDGTVAWGARNAIVIATSEPDEKIFKYSIIEDAHTDRVTCLALSPKFGEADQMLLISGGDEHIVRIWNLDSMSAVMAHSYIDTQQKVVGVDWSSANPNIVCCVSTDGSLVVWNVSHNVAQLLNLGKLTATCLSCCPHNPDLVAVGTKSGLVYVVNVHGNGKIIYKLRGHDSEISSLSWCPVETNILKGTDANDLLLASGAKDRSIFIWKAGGDGRYQTELTLPNNPLDSHQHRSKLGTAMGGWTAVCWVAPKVLLSSSSWGELISWDLSISSKSRPACKLVHACHSRGLFCIAKVQNKEETEAIDKNWRLEDTRGTTIWTLAQDRRVVCCNLRMANSEILYNVPTQGGYTYCIAASPLDTSRVAFGTGDAMLRLWNLCEPHKNTFDITMLWQKIKGKVMAVSWHPEKENLLAFGTGEGRVGVFDTNTNKPPILYRQYHRHAVYTLGWGPEPKGKNYVLYSCGDGELVYYNPEKPNQEPKSVIKKDCTEFRWKPDNSCLVVGLENGGISFLNRDLEECSPSIYSLKKAVQCFAWHPESTSTDLDLSPLRHQLAVSTNAHSIVVFDLSALSRDRSSTDDTTVNGGVSLQKIVATLNGHTAKIVDLAWSPHISGYLASASYDKTVQVWKTESQELVGTYASHCGPVHCCMWSPLDPDLLISGSADFTVRIWKLSKQEVTKPVENLTKPKKVRTKKKKHTVEKVVADLIGDSVEKISDTPPEDDNETATNVEYATTEKDIREILAIDQIRRKKNKKLVYFPVMAKAANNKEYLLNSIMDLVESSCQTSGEEGELTPANGNSNGINSNGNPENKESLVSSLFGSKEDILILLDAEKSAHAKLSQYDTVVEMDLWCNNLKENLQEAAKGRRLNDFLVSLAPSLSFKVWQEMCETYAAQLEFEGNHRKAVSYLLCIHKIDRAIQVFVEGKMFKEAYVLAKCKLDGKDPLLNVLLEKWAIAAARDGNFEDAVQCYIKLGNYKEAARLLSKRKDSRSLEVAAKLASKSDDRDFSTILAERAVTEALFKADYESAENVIQTFPQIQHCKIKVAALKELDKMLQSSDDGKIWDWLEGKSEDCMLENLSNRFPDCDQDYTKLLKSSETLEVPKDKRMLWVEVGSQIAMATVCPSAEKKLYHLVAAVGAVSQYETTLYNVQENQTNNEVEEEERNLLAKLLSQLDKQGPCSENSLFINKEPNIRKSLRAYLCYGILNWLIGCNLSQEVEERRDIVVALVENIIGDALDQQTVKFNVMSADVNKLEGLLATAIGKSNNVEDTGCDVQKEVEDLMERLAMIRNDREKFLAERLHAPNPVLVYSKARQLTSAFFCGETEEKISQLLFDVWRNATS